MGIFFNPSQNINIDNPLGVFNEMLRSQTIKLGKGTIINDYRINLYLAFKGTIGFDKQFENQIELSIIKLIKCSLKKIYPEAKFELEKKKSLISGELVSEIRNPEYLKTLIIYEVDQNPNSSKPF